MPAGRPRDHAPNGYATVREAAEVLGVSEPAVRARLNRGTLPEHNETLPSGETRRYVPREALNRDGHGPATKADADELTVTSAILAQDAVREVLAEIARRTDFAQKQRKETFDIIDAISQQQMRGFELLEQADEDRHAMLALMRDMAEAQTSHRQQARRRHREKRIMLYIVLACGMLVTILVAVDMLFFHIV